MFLRNLAASFVSNRVALIDATIRAGMTKAMNETEMNEQFRHIQAEISDALRNGAASPAVSSPGAVMDIGAVDAWHVPPLPPDFRWYDGRQDLTRKIGAQWQDAIAGAWEPVERPCLDREHHTVAAE